MATLGSEAKKARRMGERRIARLDKVIADAKQAGSNIPQRVINWAMETKKEIKSAMQGTRMYAKDGHRYKSKSQRYIQQQIERLQNAVSRVVPRYEAPRETLASVTAQLNLASSKVTAPASIYTQEQVHIFYKVTESIWDRPDVSVRDRNEAILKYFNEKRKDNKMAPLTLGEIVKMILNANQEAVRMQELQTQMPMTPEQQEMYAKAAAADESDNDKTSPTTANVIAIIEPLLEDLLMLPDPTSNPEDDFSDFEDEDLYYL